MQHFVYNLLPLLFYMLQGLNIFWILALTIFVYNNLYIFDLQS